ncbi:MAG TPA: Ig-like domain-containing protein [Gemmatimonadales bacterium]|nr:Ig-like domain-containing protein [Gemmatimonadales bacterium]
MRRLALLPLSLLLAAACGGTTSTGDSTPPKLVSATYGADHEILTLVFDEEINAATVHDAAFTLGPDEYDLDDATLVGTRQVTLDVDGGLPGAPPTVYTVTATGIADLAGNVAPSLSTTFQFGRPAPIVGAAYRLPGGQEVVLINGDGTRFVVFNYGNSSFSAAAPIGDLPESGIPFPIGAAGTRHNGSLTYFWGTDGDSYIGYDYSQGAISPPAPIEFLKTFPGCSLPGGVGAAFSLGVFSSNPNRIYLFSADGTVYRIWNYAATGAPCSAALVFPQNFGPGNAPIANVGAAFTTNSLVSPRYFLFDRAGTSYTIYYETGVFAKARSTADLGNGMLSFD